MNDKLLRRSLKSNAVFCGISGASMALAAGPLGAFLGISAMPLLVVGIALALYAPLLFWRASQEPISALEAWLAIAGDLGWVAGSAALIAMGAFTHGGTWLVAGVADIVLTFAVLQYLGLRRVRAAETARA